MVLHLKENIVIVGAGGHAKVIIDILQKSNRFNIVGATVDLKYNANSSDVLGIKIIGDDKKLPILYANGIENVFVAIGDNKLRAKLIQDVTNIGFNLVNAVSPYSCISDHAKLGNGIAVMAGAVINANAEIGNGVIINTGATVDHDCVLGDWCHVAPGCNLAGGVVVGNGSFLGVGTAIIPSVQIGRWSTIGAGSVVVKDIPDECLAFGSPAKVRNK
jgi:UDP-perosamine 4-acetyltransferase